MRASLAALLLAAPALAQGQADLSFAPSTSYAGVGDEVQIQLVATAADDQPTDIGALDAILSFDPAELELLGATQTGAGYAWFVAGFLTDPDGINTTWTDGDALFTALSQVGTPATAPQAPGLVVTTLRLRALAPTAGTTVQFLPSLGTFGLTQVLDFHQPGVDITGDISSVATVVIGGTSSYCGASAAQCPCGNGGAPGQGCANSTGAGALLASAGSTSVASDDLVFTVSNVPANQFGVVYMGGSQIELPFGDGLRCVGAGSQGVIRFPVTNAGPGGQLVVGPGLGALLGGGSPLVAGSAWNFQGWYRDPAGPCASTFNLSNAIAAVFVP